MIVWLWLLLVTSGQKKIGIYSLEIFLNFHTTTVSHASEDNTMFTLHDHEPACVIPTLCHFYNVVNPHSYLWEQCSDTG